MATCKAESPASSWWPGRVAGCIGHSTRSCYKFQYFPRATWLCREVGHPCKARPQRTKANAANLRRFHALCQVSQEAPQEPDEVLSTPDVACSSKHVPHTNTATATTHCCLMSTPDHQQRLQAPYNLASTLQPCKCSHLAPHADLAYSPARYPQAMLGWPATPPRPSTAGPPRGCQQVAGTPHPGGRGWQPGPCEPPAGHTVQQTQ